MKRYYYDLHIHSCLSPCADNDNTPNNIAGMAKICGLDIVALTDHNSCKNCPAFFEAAERYGIIPVAGIELTTSEDIHVICLFEELSEAMRFDSDLQSHRTLAQNRTDIFGEQLILDGRDEVIGSDPYVLSFATDISLEDVPALVEGYGGICYPAHIDRQSNGVIATLGTFPETPYFANVEINRSESIEEYVKRYSLQDKRIIVSSDAHCLTDMRDKENYFELDCENASQVRHRLFEELRK
ncbi:MAG: PHP domain-containing protein [Eubacterium sp.]|nr:PHP domain-containing protein [Eubacterium sp.]